MPYIVTTRARRRLGEQGRVAITTLPPVHSRAAALAKLVEAHGPLVLTHRVVGSVNFVYQFEDGTAATIKEIPDERDPGPIPA